jgi:hypothetical protein
MIINRIMTIEEMELVIRSFKPDIFILDTVNHLINRDDRQDIVLGDIARRFKKLAIEVNGLGVIIAQLKDINKRPTEKNFIKESS